MYDLRDGRVSPFVYLSVGPAHLPVGHLARRAFQYPYSTKWEKFPHRQM